MNIPDDALEAAVPWIDNFLERRGIALRGKEAHALASYVLQAAAPGLMAQAWLEGYQVGEADTFYGENGHEPASYRNPYRPTQTKSLSESSSEAMERSAKGKG